jgi:tetratricopeptide (TPR) repeat protein
MRLFNGDTTGALDDLNRAVELGPNRVDVYNTRGAIFREMSCYDEAISDFTRALELDPFSAEALCRMGIAYLYKGEYDNAILNMEKGLNIDPSLKDTMTKYLEEAREKNRK